MKLQPEKVILIGDYEFDMLAGKRAGVTTVLLRNTNQSSSENADMVINSVLEITKILDSSLRSSNNKPFFFLNSKTR